MPQATHQLAVPALHTGVVQTIDAKAIGHVSMLLGAGRESKAASIDLSAGVLLQKKVGDLVSAGESLAVLHYQDAYARRVQEAAQELQKAYTIGSAVTEKEPLIWKIIGAE